MFPLELMKLTLFFEFELRAAFSSTGQQLLSGLCQAAFARTEVEGGQHVLSHEALDS